MHPGDTRQREGLLVLSSFFTETSAHDKRAQA
jgi:hypothetical protein